MKGTLNGDFDDVIKIEYDDKIDSTEVINNSFTFEGEVSSPQAFQFKFDSITSSDVYYLEDDTLVFDIIVDDVKVGEDFYKDYEVKHISGGKTQELIAEMNEFLKSTPRSKTNRDRILSKMDSVIKKNPHHDYLGKLLSELSMNQDLLYNDVRSLISKMDTDKLNSKDIELLEKYQQSRRNFQIGSKIPDYNLISITSETQNLKSEFSRYNLIQAWNSWCKECKSDQEELLDIYKTYHFKGFEIITVSLDTNQNDWITAVSQAPIPWKSFRIENGFTGKMATEMGIIDLPQYYLVDESGRIIEINLSLNELHTILRALL